MATKKKEKKSIFKRWWFWLIIVVVVIGIAAGNGGGQKEQDKPDTDLTSKSDNSSTQKETQKTYDMNETWTVDDQWELTITGVTETQDRNQFSEKTAAAVYIVNYTYKNIGYEDEVGIMDGLFFDLSDGIVDATGVMGYSYPGDIVDYAQETPIGATCNAQACIGVDNPGDFKINVTKYDGHGNKQSASFQIVVS